tara:strand:- start:9303 stop:9959 length:657 start_codon:yes stop_codon:yes gene_type:complete
VNYKFTPLLLALICNPVSADNYSSTSAPTSNVSGSISNIGVMNMPTRQFQNQYGNGIVCQGETFAIQPYISTNMSFTRPYRETSPQYLFSNVDANEDGDPDNPSQLIGERYAATGQKDSFAITPGISLSWNIPLDRRAQKLCRKLAAKQVQFWENRIADQRISYELGRIKHCKSLLSEGVIITGKFAAICSDVSLGLPPNSLPQHQHSISPLENDVKP